MNKILKKPNPYFSYLNNWIGYFCGHLIYYLIFNLENTSLILSCKWVYTYTQLYSFMWLWHRNKQEFINQRRMSSFVRVHNSKNGTFQINNRTFFPSLGTKRNRWSLWGTRYTGCQGNHWAFSFHIQLLFWARMFCLKTEACP